MAAAASAAPAPAPPLSPEVALAADALATALRERFGDATQAVLFYGSCLRRNSPEGVLDFYVLVDDYRRAYARRALAWLNALLPPNVFYLECPSAVEGNEPWRAKVAVLSVTDFEAAVEPSWPEVRVWARFAQPSALLWARDEKTRRRVARARSQALRTFVGWAPAWIEPHEDRLRFDSAAFWSRGFEETYRAEVRGEQPATICALHAAAPAYYEAALREALREHAQAGDFGWREVEGEHELRLPAGACERARVHWQQLRRRGRLRAAAGLAKCVLTFEGWARYGLWKLERHRGAPIPVSERQLRHPLLLGWPVLYRLLRERILR